MPAPGRGTAVAQTGTVTAQGSGTVTVNVAGESYVLPYISDAPPPVGATVWVMWAGRTGLVLHAAAGSAGEVCDDLVPYLEPSQAGKADFTRFGPDYDTPLTVTLTPAVPIPTATVVVKIEQNDGNTETATATGGPWAAGEPVTVQMPSPSSQTWDFAAFVPEFTYEIQSGRVCWAA